MALEPGARLGPYEIAAQIGAGGMGEVYKARDTRLDRVVAVKVLSPTVAADPGFRERFDREARTISQLDHPHICALHDVGEHKGTAFLVLQYLEGETLERRLRQGPLKQDEALRIGIQVADALDRAHRAGIVHRDLKPGNVMLTKSGAKLLDFGLAKTTAVPATEGATMMLTSPSLTAQGAILGTFQYMAPEQLEGGEADPRTDLFAFGALMYEMVTGRKAFEANSHASLIAAILEHEPTAIRVLLPLAPAALDHIVGKCLAKDPEDRWQSARDVMTELKWITVENGGAPSAAPERSAIPGVHRTNVRAAVIAAAGILIGAALAYIWLGQLGRGPNTLVSRVLVATAPAERLQAIPTDWPTNEGRPSRTAMAWSPDGGSIVFSAVQDGKQHLYLRTLDQLEATIVAGTEGASNPFFSPDGRWIGFVANNGLKKIAFAGGPPTTICDVPSRFGGASWGSDDSIVYSQGRDGLWRVPAAGGTPQRLTQVREGELKHVLPQILPGSQAVLYTITNTPLPKWDDTQVVVQSLSTGERKVLVESGADGRYAASGHLLYLQRGTLMAAPFDVTRTQITGGAIGVVADVMQAANTTNEAFETGAGQFAVSQSGSLLYLPGGVSLDPERSMVWVDRSGALQPLPVPARAYMNPRLSPDGTRVAVWTQGDRNVWIYELSRNVLTRLTSEGRNARAIWTPDGQRVTYGSATAGDENVVWKTADSGGAIETLTTCNCLSFPGAWAPDGRALIVVQQDSIAASRIQLLSLAGDRRLIPLTDRRFYAAYPDISPDGHWIAYAADDSGRREVYVQSFPQPGSRYQVSTNGGSAPAWSHDGRELFYVTAETVGGQAALTAMMSVPVKAGRTFDAGAPRKLFEGRFGLTAGVRGYDVSSDGRRFLMVQQKDRPPTLASHMILVENWFDELKRKVPVK